MEAPREDSKQFSDAFREAGSVDNDGRTELLKVCDRSTKATFRIPDEFNKVAIDYIKHKLASDRVTTDDWNNWQVYNALNTVYLDGDLYFPASLDDGEIDQYNLEIAIDYKDAFLNNLRNHEVVNYFVFTPCEDQFTITGNKKKGGFHVFLFFHENISKDDRKRVYNLTRDSLMHNREFNRRIETYGISISDESDFAKLFDPQPTETAFLLIPFAVKKGGRNYKLVDSSFTDDTLFVKGTIQDNRATAIEENNENRDDEIDDDLERLFATDEADDHDNTWRTVDRFHIGRIAAETLNFFTSLKYICVNSQFFTYLENHDNRFNTIYPTVYRWYLYLLTFTGSTGLSPSGLKKLALKLTINSLLPLVKLCVNPNENTHRGTLESFLENMKQVMNRSDIIRDFENIKANYARAYAIIKDGSKSKIRDQLRGTIIYREVVEEKMRTYAQEDLAKPAVKRELDSLFNLYCNEFSKALSKGKKAINKFSILLKQIMESFTKEVLPFRYSNSVMPGEDLRKGVDFGSLDGENLVNYNNVISLWLKFFTIFSFYNSPKSYVDAYRAAINTLVRRFTYQRNGEGNAKISYIYNVRQFDEIRTYPYNQWIRDDGDALLLNWFAHIYNKYLANTFRTDQKDGFVNDFFDLIINSDALKNFRGTIDIYPLTNFEKEMKQVATNIIGLSSFNEQIAPPLLIQVTDDSCWFPMRNGLLEFVLYEEGRTDGRKRGDVVFHNENYTRLMDAQTNVLWNDNYSTSVDNIPYNRIVKAIEQILPNREKREYVISCYAQALHSVGQRDQVHQHYGTGAEGKSLLNHMMLVMLGLCASHSQVVENGDSDVYSIQHGLAQTLKAEALIQINNSSHDSGGIIELVNCRFCTVQEPITAKNGQSVKIDVNTIKALTGGSFMKGRQIYEKAISFRPKVFTTIQTNRDMGFSEVDLAVRRRTKTIYFTEKFLAKSTMTAAAIPYVNPHVYDADPELARSIDNDVRYWEALFRYLLPYAQDFIRQNRSGLSDIPCPHEIEVDTEKTLSHSNGVMSWLAKNIEADPKTGMKFRAIVGMIDSAYANTTRSATQGQDYDREMAAMSKIDREELIVTSLMGRFAAHHLYKLRDEFWDKEFYRRWINSGSTDEDIENKDGLKVVYPPAYPKVDVDETADTPADTLRWIRYFDPQPINNVYTLESRYLDTANWQDRIFIVGFELKNLK